MYAMTLNPGHGSAIEVAKLGLFKRGEARDVELTDAMLEQFRRGTMWTVAAIKPKPKAASTKEK